MKAIAYLALTASLAALSKAYSERPESLNWLVGDDYEYEWEVDWDTWVLQYWYLTVRKRQCHDILCDWWWECDYDADIDIYYKDLCFKHVPESGVFTVDDFITLLRDKYGMDEAGTDNNGDDNVDDWDAYQCPYA
jgi:hypothetical protein